jgi:uncharacterized protein with von Willebrand factor type A (vWA) domain
MVSDMMLQPTPESTWRYQLSISGHSDLFAGKVYEVLTVEGDWYRIVDESGEKLFIST